MFDFAWSEFALIGIVGLLFIGPKDMPVAIKTVTNLLKKGRKMAAEFQTHVDDLVKEADLGEARDQFRQLKSFNVRGQVMRALDEDGSIKRTFSGNPLSGLDTPAGPKFALPSQSLPAGDVPVSAQSMLPTYDVENRPLYGHRMIDTLPGASVEESAALEAADPAPSILPPSVAGRLRVERARAPAPRFVPPQAAGRQHPSAGKSISSASDPDYRPIDAD